MELLSTALNAQRNGPNDAQNRTGQNGENSFHPFGEVGFTFGDLLDIINPLQHIPVISTIYREITGDEIAALPRMIGGGLFGGLAGLGAATVNMIFDEASGKDLGEHIYTAFLGDDEATGTLVAEAADPDAPWYMAGKVTYSRTPADGTEPVNIAKATDTSDDAAAPLGAQEVTNIAPADGAVKGEPKGQIDRVAAFSPDLSGPRVAINNLPWLDGTQTAQAAPLDPVTVTSLADAAKAPVATQPPPAIQNVRPARAVNTPPSTAIPARATIDTSANSRPGAGAAPAPKAIDFTNSMMDGLNKYRAMAIEKNNRMPVVLNIVR